MIFLLIFSSTFIIMYLCITSFQLEEANVYKEVKQFTYKDGSQFVFMDLVYKLYIYAYDLVVINTFLKFLITWFDMWGSSSHSHVLRKATSQINFCLLVSPAWNESKLLVLQNTYEEIRLNAADVGDRTKWLKEGMDCVVLFWNGKVTSIDWIGWVLIGMGCTNRVVDHAVFK